MFETVQRTLVTSGELDMDVRPAEVTGKDATVQVTFLNQGERPATVAVDAHDAADALRYTIVPREPVSVPAGGTAGPVAVRIAPRSAPPMSRRRSYEVTIRGVPSRSDGTLDPPLTRTIRYTTAPPVTFPRLPLTTVVLGFILVTVLALQWAFDGPLAPASPPPGTPVATSVAVVPGVRSTTAPRPLGIEHFALEHRSPAYPYELSWQASGATSATINGQLVATQGRLPLYAPVHSAIYTLVVRYGRYRVIAGLQIIVRDPMSRARPPTPVAGLRPYVLLLPRIDTFALQAGSSVPTAHWGVRDATRVLLQNTPVPSHGQRAVPPGTAAVRLVAVNAVGTQQRALRLAPRASSTSLSLLLMNPTRLDFPDTKIGTRSPVGMIRVVNLGPSPVTISSVTIAGRNRPNFHQTTTCSSASIAVDDGCTISVTFAPATSGTRRATLLIAGALSGSPRAVSLQGRGVEP